MVKKLVRLSPKFKGFVIPKYRKKVKGWEFHYVGKDIPHAREVLKEMKWFARGTKQKYKRVGRRIFLKAPARKKLFNVI